MDDVSYETDAHMIHFTEMSLSTVPQRDKRHGVKTLNADGCMTTTCRCRVTVFKRIPESIRLSIHSNLVSVKNTAV